MAIKPKTMKQSHSFINKPGRDRSISSMEVKKVKVKVAPLNLNSLIGEESKVGEVRAPTVGPEKSNSFNQSKSFTISKNQSELFETNR